MDRQVVSGWWDMIYICLQSWTTPPISVTFPIRYFNGFLVVPIVVEALIPDPIGNLEGCQIRNRLGLSSGHVETNSAMTQISGLSVEVRRNGQ